MFWSEFSALVEVYTLGLLHFLHNSAFIERLCQNLDKPIKQSQTGSVDGEFLSLHLTDGKNELCFITVQSSYSCSNRLKSLPFILNPLNLRLFLLLFSLFALHHNSRPGLSNIRLRGQNPPTE